MVAYRAPISRAAGQSLFLCLRRVGLNPVRETRRLPILRDDFRQSSDSEKRQRETG